MFPDGTGGLASCAEAETIGQARLVNAAAVRRVWRMGDFMGLEGGKCDSTPGTGVTFSHLEAHRFRGALYEVRFVTRAGYFENSFFAVAARPGPSIP